MVAPEHSSNTARSDGPICSSYAAGSWRLDEAIASLDRAANISPNEATIRRTRARVLMKAARFREVLADFGHAIRLEPGFNSKLRDEFAGG